MSIKVITFNANGIRAAARKGFFNWMDAQDADVVCIQETKAQAHQFPPEAVAERGFHFYYVDAVKKGYSGVAIYSRQRPDAVVRGLGWPDIDAEARYIQANYGPLSIASIYFPSGTMGEVRQAVKYDFMERFNGELRAKRSDGRSYILCGDYNIAHKPIDVFSPASNANTTGYLPAEREWFDGMIDGMGFVDAFRVVNQQPKQYTWWSGWPQAWAKNLGWRIDYQIITPDLRESVRSAAIYKDERFSDHAPVIIEYDLTLG